MFCTESAEVGSGGLRALLKISGKVSNMCCGGGEAEQPALSPASLGFDPATPMQPSLVVVCLWLHRLNLGWIQGCCPVLGYP